jgi:hypothetical protein
MEPADDAPYCKNCGYNLSGSTESSKCPECGKPIVEVLIRTTFAGQGKRYASPHTLFGLPWVAVGYGPRGLEKCGRPVGVISIGDAPRGVIAIGGRPVGILAIGGFARGVVAVGGFALGVIGYGGFAVGVLAYGGFAAGVWALGGFALALYKGWGGVVRYLWPW